MNDVDVAPPSPPAAREPETSYIPVAQPATAKCAWCHGPLHNCFAADRTAEYAGLLRRVVAWKAVEFSEPLCVWDDLVADIRAALPTEER